VPRARHRCLAIRTAACGIRARIVPAGETRRSPSKNLKTNNRSFLSATDIIVSQAGVQVGRVGGTRFYYGWVVLGVSTLAMIGTLPGRTQGLGLITEPLLRDLAISRVSFAQINLVATLVGSLFCIGIGKLIDRTGSRIVLTVTALLLGLTVLAMSIGFMAVFPTVGAIVQSSGWRVAWAAIGLALVFALAPIAWLFDRSTPEAIGQEVDGGGATRDEQEISGVQATLAEALRSPAFWVFALASSIYGLVASGIGLLNESILVERGFTPDIYYQALAVTAITGLLGNFAAGALAGRTSLRTILVTALLVLAVGLAALAHVTTVAQVMAQAVAMGVAGGFIMVVFFSFWGRAYGRAHLGRIQGAAQAMTVVASALGPLFLAMWSEATGSYAMAFYVLAVVVAVLAIAAAAVSVPRGARATG
jgi:MFS family permease